MATHLYLWLKKEINKAIPAIIFFAIAFNLITFTDNLIFKAYEISYFLHTSYLVATIGALFAGKIIVITDSLPLINAFPNKPLIYNISWKFFLYSLITLLFRLVEDFLHLIFKHEKLYIIIKYLDVKISSPAFWAIQMWIVITFGIYIVSVEFIRAIGKKQIQKILFG